MKKATTKKLLYYLGLLFIMASLHCKIVDDIFDDGPNDPGTTSGLTVGDTLWIHESPVKDSMFMSSTLAIGKNGDIYYAASGTSYKWVPARIFALKQNDGSLRWMSGELDHSSGISSPIVVGDDGTVYVIGYYTLYAMDPNTGGFKWTWEVPNELPYPDNPDAKFYTKGQIGALALTDDGNLILGSVGSGVYSRAIYGIDKNGNRIYYNNKAVEGGVFSGIYIGKNNMAYYYTNQNGKPALIAVNAATGAIVWTLEISTHLTGINNIAILDNGNLFCAFRKVGESMVTNHIINGSNGSFLWSGTSRSNGNRKWIGPNGQFYEYDNGINLVNAASGEKSLIVGCEFGAITENNRLVTAFTDADRIRKLGVFLPDGLMDYNVWMTGLTGNDIAISNDYSIYAIVNLHPSSYLPTEICAIKGESSLAKSGWPRTFHDNRNTSNIDKQ
ncbi:MAG: PQQ-like beta-propeller repeat protein [Saprospiraceae bacterium]|nr:PQQ-like beta-propeller repeat protein [Saprospiraceae bacterium]